MLCFICTLPAVFSLLFLLACGVPAPLATGAAAFALAGACVPAAVYTRRFSRRKTPAPPQPSSLFAPGPEPVDSRTRELLAANSELSSLNFTISHEIKAPVRAIDGYARIFLEDYSERLDSEARGMVQNIRNICAETIALSNKLLEYTRLAREEPCNEIVDLQSMVQECFLTLRNAYPGAGSITLCFDSELPPIIGDPVLLRQAVVNLLSNALKFTCGKENGVVRAGFDVQNEKDVYYIRDNGAGFDMQFSQNLFGMFQRMHTSDEFEGSGVGLAIVRKVLQLHGGRAWITGEVGRGATVYFTLPSDRVLRKR